MRKTLNALRIILSIRKTIDINEILNAIRNIPVIGKFFPDEFFGLWIIKFIATVMSFISEIMKAFFGKLCIFAFIFLVSAVFSSFNETSQGTAFLFGFLAVSLAWTFLYSVFRSTPEGEYAVFHMGMDAKTYVNARFLYNAFNVVIGYTVFGIPAAIFSCVKWYLAILLPLAGLGFMAAPLGFEMSVYAIKLSRGKKKNRKGVPVSIDGNLTANALISTFILIGAAIAGGLILFYDLHFIVVILYLLSVLSLVPGLLLMKKFPFNLYKTALYAEKVKMEIYKKQQKKEMGQSFEVKVNEAEESGRGLKGYRYLNDIFFKRHGNIIWKNQIISIVITVLGIALLSVFLYFEVTRTDDVTKSVLRYLFSKHPGIFIFALSVFNTGAFMSRTMFAGCDSSMLVYGFYRTPEALRKMFRLRVLSVFKYNMIPSSLMIVFAIVSIALTGGERYFGEYFSIAVTITVFTLLFSLRHLTIYYILQPYTKDFMIKSKLYGYLSFFYGCVVVIVMFIPMPAAFSAIAGIIITGLYFLIADKLIYKFAPKTFKIK